jgi:hypothetical protein
MSYITVIDFIVNDDNIITHGSKSIETYPTLTEAINEADSWEDVRCAVCKTNDFTALYIHEGGELEDDDDDIVYRRM